MDVWLIWWTDRASSYVAPPIIKTITSWGLKKNCGKDTIYQIFLSFSNSIKENIHVSHLLVAALLLFPKNGKEDSFNRPLHRSSKVSTSNGLCCVYTFSTPRRSWKIYTNYILFSCLNLILSRRVEAYLEKSFCYLNHSILVSK